MAAVVYVQEIVESAEVHVVPSTSKTRHCSMASTSDQVSSGRKLGKKRSGVCAKALMALKDRKKLKKTVTRKVKKFQHKSVFLLKARRARARINKELGPEIKEHKKEFRALQAQTQKLIEESAKSIDRVKQLTRNIREFREEVESRLSFGVRVLSAFIPHGRF